MLEQLGPFAHNVARIIEIVGIATMVLGAVAASLGVIRQLLLKSFQFEKAYHWYRTQLGQAILLGLEFLVAADIIDTVAVDPTFESLGVLALIVVIRTFLSFALEVEINGHWPWQGRKLGAETGGGDAVENGRAPQEEGGSGCCGP